MTRDEAFTQAKQRARKYHRARYVVIESIDPLEYDVAFESELDGFHLGSRVVAFFDEDGTCYMEGAA